MCCNENNKPSSDVSVCGVWEIGEVLFTMGSVGLIIKEENDKEQQKKNYNSYYNSSFCFCLSREAAKKMKDELEKEIEYMEKMDLLQF